MNSKKLIAGPIALAMAFTVSGAVFAQTTATADQLAAHIAQLQNELASLQGQLGTTSTTGTASSAPAACAGITFSRNLTLGSSGTDVKCLQALLNTDPTTQVAASGVGSKGMESMTFGGLTKAAVIAFQNKNAATVLTPVGLTTGTGFVGASTRVALNAMLAGTVVNPVQPVSGNLPAGCTSTTGFSATTGQSCSGSVTLVPGCTSTTGFSATTGQSCSGSVTLVPGCTSTTGFSTTTGQSCSGAVSTSGQEGTIIVSANPTPANGTNAYEGDTKDSIFGVKIKATGSDMDVQRVTLKFLTRPYSYLSNIYLYNGSTVVASSPLNADTVSKVSATDYEITLSNFTSKVIVPKDGTTVLTVEADVLPAISSDVLATNETYNLFLDVTSSGVRAVDGTGLNQYSGGETDTRYAIIRHSQTTNATLTVSLNANTVHSRNIVADMNGDVTGANLLSFDLQATKDSALIDEIDGVTFSTATVNGSVGTIPDTVYLVDASGSVIGTGEAVTPDLTPGVYKFADLNYTVAKDTTQTLSIKVDDNSVTDTQHYSVTVAGTGFIAEKSDGSNLTATGSASNTGYEAYLYNVGPVFTLTSITAPTTTASNPNGSSTTTSTISTTFNIQVQAVSGDVYIEAQNGAENAFVFDYGENGADLGVATSIVYNQPSGVTKLADAVASPAKYWYKVSQGSTVTFAVSPTLNTTSGGSNLFDLRMKSITWYIGTGTNDATAPVLGTGAKTSSYMSTDSSWISGTATLQ